MAGIRQGEYATSTRRVKDIRKRKDSVYLRGMPSNEVAQLARDFSTAGAYEHLRGQDNVFLVAPSTTGRNKLPYYFAKHLQQEYGGDVATGWAVPIVREKASMKGGLGKMRNPARFAPIDPRLLRIPKHANLVLVDDVVTTGETTDALRELLAVRGIHVDSVVSLGQSELRKVSQRDIERIDLKLGEPSLQEEIESVLQGRLKHKANYIERSIHEDTKAEIRRYFRDEHRRLERLEAVHAGADRGVRRRNGSHLELQSARVRETGNPGRRESEIGNRSGYAARGGSGQRGFLETARSLEQLRAEVAHRGVDLAGAEKRALALLEPKRMEARDANLTKTEVGRYLRGVSSLTSEDIAHNGLIRVSRQERARNLKGKLSVDASAIKELEALRAEVSSGGDIQQASGRALTALKAETFSRVDRLRTAHEIGAFLGGDSEALPAKRIVMSGQARALTAKQNGVGTAVQRSVGRR
jgi:hypothetical protein